MLLAWICQVDFEILTCLDPNLEFIAWPSFVNLVLIFFYYRISLIFKCNIRTTLPATYMQCILFKVGVQGNCKRVDFEHVTNLAKQKKDPNSDKPYYAATDFYLVQSKLHATKIAICNAYLCAPMRFLDWSSVNALLTFLLRSVMFFF